jgi:hypothetical protein
MSNTSNKEGRMMRIVYGNEYREMDESGNISRPEIGMKASGEWRIVGAVLFNNFGNVVAHACLADILAGNIKDWQYKNGKQKWHVRDYDHGSYRIWMSPKHSIR